MRALLSVLALLVAASTADQPPTLATYVTSEDIQTKVKQKQQGLGVPEPNLRVVDAGGYNITVGAIYRGKDSPDHSAIHFKVSEVYYVIGGAATLVSGGTMVNAKTRSSDAENVRLENGPGSSGTAIQGGESRRIKVGDVVIIPAGVPHWFSEIEGSITYVVLRVDPDRLLPLK
jgi:mannose-6-phosphate isomerase-like protein (cupin superfamily)